MMLLSLENISKGFGKRDDSSYRPVLNELSLQVNEGERIAILGPSGSGKTTLLNLVGGLDSPDEGSVLYRGEDITGYGKREIDLYRNRQIGFVFQFHHLL
ncbi:MAG: ATP-binding cassette domain-containing protein, partial [Bacteroidetes bacterium]|nr:ATP-binding cassette domain-containing protein [Bacteroidota bacterium]